MIVFLIGGSSSGKSSFAAELISRIPSFRLLSDLDELLVRADLEKMFTASKQSVRYLQGGGLEIIAPEVWDQCLAAAVMPHREEEHLIIEFARGNDKCYLTMHRISCCEAYDPSFTILYEIFGERLNDHAWIIEMYAPLELRKERNQHRADTGQHHMAEKELIRLFGERCFMWDQTKESYTVPTMGVTIPVLSFMNGVHAHIETFVDAFVREVGL